MATGLGFFDAAPASLSDSDEVEEEEAAAGEQPAEEAAPVAALAPAQPPVEPPQVQAAAAGGASSIGGTHTVAHARASMWACAEADALRLRTNLLLCADGESAGRKRKRLGGLLSPEEAAQLVTSTHASYVFARCAARRSRAPLLPRPLSPLPLCSAQGR